MKKQFAMMLMVAASMVSVNALASGDIEAGKAATEKYNCAACHGKDFNSPVDPAYPKLAGQYQDYLEHALVAYQRGSAGPNGRVNAIMAGMAKPLSQQDVHNIAAYLSSLPSSLVQRKPDPFLFAK